MRLSIAQIALGLGLMSTVCGIELDISSESSVRSVLSDIAYDMMTYYHGNETGRTPGILPGPCQDSECYYWWTAGGMWAALINYYQYTGDASYQQTVLQALAFQIGPDKNYNPPNQSRLLSIDDQAFWAFAALEAAEAGIPNLEDGQTPAWIELAEAVFNFQVLQWDSETCNGGFRWQVYPFNAGYNLKNSISNAAFFNLAARLARFTGNSTYADWAFKVWDWMEDSALFETMNKTLYVWDNVDVDVNCTVPQSYIWTYTYGSLMLGSAMLYNHTNGSSQWQTRLNTLLDSTLSLFFPPEYGFNIMSEVLCEKSDNCNNDQSTFKAYTVRWMAVTSLIAPFTAARISSKLIFSAEGAALQCSGGDNGRRCGRQWWTGVWDGSGGVGQQMSALAVIGATQITPAMAPLRASSASTGRLQGNTTTANNASSSNTTGNGGGEGQNSASRAVSQAGLITIAFAIMAAGVISNLL